MLFLEFNKSIILKYSDMLLCLFIFSKIKLQVVYVYIYISAKK